MPTTERTPLVTTMRLALEMAREALLEEMPPEAKAIVLKQIGAALAEAERFYQMGLEAQGSQKAVATFP